MKENVEYVYAAMILHSAGKTIDEKGITAVLESAGVDVDAARVKGLVASLASVDIEEASVHSNRSTSGQWRPPPRDLVVDPLKQQPQLRKLLKRKRRMTPGLKAWAPSWLSEASLVLQLEKPCQCKQ